MQPLIEFIVDGKLFGVRNTWGQIPRAGDLILLQDGDVLVKVKSVIWGDDSAAKALLRERQWVQLVCERVKKP